MEGFNFESSVRLHISTEIQWCGGSALTFSLNEFNIVSITTSISLNKALPVFMSHPTSGITPMSD